MWPDRRIIDLFKTEFPIVLAPMAGIMDADLVIAAAQGGALGSLPCAMLSAEKTREQVNIIRQRVSAPVNMNFFCHKAVDADPAREAGWKARLTQFELPPHAATGDIGLDRVELEVWWRTGRTVRTYTLDAYRPHVLTADDAASGGGK